MLIVAGVIVLALLVVLAVVALNHSPTGSNGTSGGSGGQHNGTAASQSPRSQASVRQSPAIDPCVVGTWIVTLQQVTNTINNEPVQFAGDNGWTVVIQPSGRASETWTNSELTAVVGGNDWEEIVNGSATYDIKTEGSQIVFSDQSVSGTFKLLENGTDNNSGRLTLQQGNATYSCSGNSFRETTANGVSAFVRAS